MAYSIPNTWTLDDYEVPWNTELSAGDADSAMELYPWSFHRVGAVTHDRSLWVKDVTPGRSWSLLHLKAVESFQLEGLRIGILRNDGVLAMKEGPLDAVWSEQHTGVKSFQLSGLRIGVVRADDVLVVKHGEADAQWSEMHTGVRKFLLFGDRVAVLTHDNRLLAKEGSLDAQWSLLDFEIGEIILTQNWILALKLDGSLICKTGPLNASWTELHDNVAQLRVAGSRVGILQNDGVLSVKKGLSAAWKKLHVGVKDFRITEDRIWALTVNGALDLKDGPLDSQWALEQSEVKAFDASGYVAAAIAGDTRELRVKDYAAKNGWQGGTHFYIEDVAVERNCGRYRPRKPSMRRGAHLLRDSIVRTLKP